MVIPSTLVLSQLKYSAFDISSYELVVVHCTSCDNEIWTEFVDGMSLKEFVRKAHSLIDEGKLSLREWSSTVKYIIWKLVSVLRWLHDVTHCFVETLSLSPFDYLSFDDLNGLESLNRVRGWGGRLSSRFGDGECNGQQC